MKYALFVLMSIFIGGLSFAQTTYTWNGSVSTSWTNQNNWTPNTGTPGAADHVVIVNGTNVPTLAANAGCTNFTMTSGTLDLGGFVLTPTGNAVFTNGTITNGTLTVNGGTGNTATFTNTTFSATGILNLTTGAITINGGMFNAAVAMNQTGAVQTSGTGNATFNSTFSLTNSGSGNFRTNGNMTFNGAVTLVNTGTAYILPELTAGNTYNSTLTLNNSSTANIRIGYTGTTTFNGNISVTNTNTGSILFGEQPTASLSLANGNTISVGGGGFTNGQLYIRRLTQVGGTAQNITLTGSASFLSYNNTFNAAVTVTAPAFALSSTIYNGATTFTKTGSSSDATVGGNTFNSTLTVNHFGTTGYWSFGNGTADTYNGDVYSNNNSQDRIIFGHNSSGNAFNGNLILTQIGSSVGTALTWNNGTSATIASGKTISIGAAGYSVGYLYLQRVTQLGADAINLTTTGTSSVNVGPTSVFLGDFTITAPDIYAVGATYSNPVVYNKTGAGNNHNQGYQNIYNSTVAINNSGTGYFMLSYNSADQFNDDVTITSTSTGPVSLGWSGGTGTPTIAAGKTILIGGAGFTGSYLQFGGLIQNGNAPMNLTLTGASSFYIVNTPSACVFGGPLTVTAPDLYIRGGTFNGATTFTKTGGGSNHNNGALNIFNSTLTINQQSNAGYLMLGYNSADQFNDDITVTSTGTGGIAFGWTAGTGTPTLAAGKNISVGGAGFSAGWLRLGSFTQLGTAATNLTMTGNSAFYIDYASSPCVIGGDLNVTAPDLYIRGGTFNGDVVFTKTGGTSNHNNGVQNIFNGTFEINQQSSNYFMVGYNSNDLFNDDITVTSTNSGGIYMGYTSGTGTPTLAAGKTITVGGAGFSSGFLYFGTFTQLGNQPINLTFTGTSTYLAFARNSVFGGDITCVSPSLYFNGAVFNGTVTATKNGSVSDQGTGGNTFNDVSSFTNSGAGYLMFGNGTADTWNADVTFTNSGSERLLPCWNSAANAFNGNITVNSIGSSTGINFCGGSTTATATLAATKTIQVGGGGFSAGYLILQRFTQLGSAPINLTLTNTSNYIQMGPTSSFGGSFTTSAPNIYPYGATYNGAATFTKTGGANNHNNGNLNIFNSTVIINQQSSTGYFAVGYNSAEVFSDDITVTSTGTGGIYLGLNSGTGTPTLAAGKTVQVGGAGFSSGFLYFGTFTQLGSAPVNLTFTGTTTSLIFARNSVFGGNITSVTPSVLFNGGTFNGTVTSTKNGSPADAGSGGNIFNGTSSFTNSGSGYLMFGNGTADTWNADVTFNNSGSERILPCWNSAGNQFNGNITVATSGSATGIHFCGGATTATATLAATKTIQTGGGGYSKGYLILPRFTQLGSAAVNLTLTSTASYLQFGPTSAFGGDVTSSSPGLYFHGCTFNGTTTCTKTGTTNDQSNGGNIFQGVSVMNNTGTGYLMFANVSADTWNNDVTFSNSGSERILPAWTASGNVFNGNIYVNSTGSSTGIHFCGGGSSSATLAAGKTIAVGGTGFNKGYLILPRFTQLGNAALSVTLAAGSSYIQFGPSSAFGGNVTTVSPGLYYNGATFNGTVDGTKNGTTNDASTGGNVFNSASTFTNSGTGYLLFANTSADDYNSDVAFVKTTTGLIYPNYNTNCTYSGDISTNSSTVITFGANTSGRTTLDGGNAQSISKNSGGANPTFTRLTLAKSASDVTLNTRINVSVDLAMTTGVVNTTSTNILYMNNAATTTIGTANSYVNGPMSYDMALNGNRTLNLPIGKSGDWRPAVLNLTHNSGTNFVYTAEVFNYDANLFGYTLPVTLSHVSHVHYWQLDRSAATNLTAATATLYYDANDGVSDPSNLRMVKTIGAGTAWNDIGGTGTAATSGSITSTVNFTTFSKFTIANLLAGINSLPIELLSFEAKVCGQDVCTEWVTASELNNDFFTVERSDDGVNFMPVGTIDASGTINHIMNYSFTDVYPLDGRSYYRLKQTDFDGNYTYSEVVAVYFDHETEILLYPNPTTNTIFIASEKSMDFGIVKIIDANGKLVREFAANNGNSNQFRCDVSDLPAGLYFIVIQNGENNVSKAFTKE